MCINLGNVQKLMQHLADWKFYIAFCFLRTVSGYRKCVVHAVYVYVQLKFCFSNFCFLMYALYLSKADVIRRKVR